MEKHEDAYKDAVAVLKNDPKNKPVAEVLVRLNPIIQQRVRATVLKHPLLIAGVLLGH